MSLFRNSPSTAWKSWPFCILSDRETLLFNSRVEGFSFGGSLIEWDANSNTRNSGSPTDEPILKCCGGIVGMPPSRKARLTWPLRLRSTTTTVDDPCNSNCWTGGLPPDERTWSGLFPALSSASSFHAMQPITYFNRYTGCLEQEAVYGGRFSEVGLWSGGGPSDC